MELYISLVHDRHRDPEVKVFHDRDAAIADTWARFRATVAHEDMIREEPCTSALLLLTYGEEADYAFCERVELSE